MQSEALRNIRTMRDVMRGIDVARSRRPKTTNSLSRTVHEEHSQEVHRDGRTERLLRQEQARFAARRRALERSRQGLLRARSKLAATISKNRALMELRRELQLAGWERDALPPPRPAADHSDAPRATKHLEVRY